MLIRLTHAQYLWGGLTIIILVLIASCKLEKSIQLPDIAFYEARPYTLKNKPSSFLRIINLQNKSLLTPKCQKGGYIECCIDEKISSIIVVPYICELFLNDCNVIIRGKNNIRFVLERNLSLMNVTLNDKRKYFSVFVDKNNNTLLEYVENPDVENIEQFERISSELGVFSVATIMNAILSVDFNSGSISILFSEENILNFKDFIGIINQLAEGCIKNNIEIISICFESSRVIEKIGHETKRDKSIRSREHYYGFYFNVNR